MKEKVEKGLQIENKENAKREKRNEKEKEEGKSKEKGEKRNLTRKKEKEINIYYYIINKYYIVLQ